jgi:hypothetical protein
MARDFPVLLKAIFALSARHLGQTHNDDGLKKRYNQLADTHNEACINIMKDLLMSKNYQPVWTEHLFAATIILQVMEEMNGTSAVGYFHQTHQQTNISLQPQLDSAMRMTKPTWTRPMRPSSGDTCQACTALFESGPSSPGPSVPRPSGLACGRKFTAP